MKMNAVMYYGPNDVRYEQVDVPEINDDEVLVKVDSALTCGTDIKTYKRGHPVLIKTIPSGFGHEFAGTIEQLGKNVRGFNIGDRVVAANSAPCAECFYCKIGEYNLCENIEFLNGAYAEYVKIPARIVKHNLLKIPEGVSFEEAAFVEPLANVVHGAERTQILPGMTVGIVGLGPIGLMFVKMAKLKGATVIAAGRNPLKLKLAQEFGGADHIINLSENENPEHLFKDLTPEKKGLDIVVEAVGLPEIWERMFSLTRKGGTIHLFGGCKQGTQVKIDTRRLHYDEIKVMSVFHHTPLFVKESLRLISEKKIDVKKLITHTLSIKDIDKAIKLHDEGKAIKVLMKP
ncbi:MAG: alcohol dehydrogenase catalytic domain-containing protein [Candidatus Gastranaerophilales bacterium]|nr:alcohol dehydrogenase catalytic domain-containing protein [Candidatus Gastranaerophilales bacterium]